MDLFGLIRNLNPFKVKTGTRPRAAHEVLLLTAMASRVIGVGAGDQAQDGLAHKVPSMEIATTMEVVQELVLEKEVAAIGPPDHATPHQAHSTCGGKSLAVMGLEAGSTFTPAAQNTSVGAKSIFQGNGYQDPPLICCYHGGGIYQPGWGVTNNYRLDTPEACQDMVDHTVPPGYFSKLRHLPNTEFLGQYNNNLAWQVAMGSQLRLRFKQEVRTVETEVHGLHNQTQNLETLLKSEVDMKKVAEAKNVDLAKEQESLLAQFFDL
ncbi:hypothetical protein Tco_1543186 [Tanacetum coccineum]